MHRNVPLCYYFISLLQCFPSVSVSMKPSDNHEILLCKILYIVGGTGLLVDWRRWRKTSKNNCCARVISALTHSHSLILSASVSVPLLLQREAIQNEIKRKKEALKEENQRRRSQCRSVEECKASTINSDHLGHIERSRSCSYVRTCSTSRRRWDILVHFVLRHVACF